jgi:hypothetical protein
MLSMRRINTFFLAENFELSHKCPLRYRAFEIRNLRFQCSVLALGTNNHKGVLILVQYLQNVKIVANRFHRIKVRWGGCFKKNYQHKGSFYNLLTREVKLNYSVKQGCRFGYRKDPYSCE